MNNQAPPIERKLRVWRQESQVISSEYRRRNYFLTRRERERMKRRQAEKRRNRASTTPRIQDQGGQR
jgi:hypothetical protein